MKISNLNSPLAASIEKYLIEIERLGLDQTNHCAALRSLDCYLEAQNAVKEYLNKRIMWDGVMVYGGYQQLRFTSIRLS